MSTHPLEIMYAGDDWEILATLIDDTGHAYDLSGTPIIQWTLLDGQGSRVIESSETNVSVTDAVNGKCKIVIPHLVTTRLITNMYTDVLRLTISNVVSTLSVGQINVFADPWKVAAAVAAKYKRIVP